MLLRHWLRRAASRAAWTAGNNNEIKTAMMAITTKSSINVKPFRLLVICSSFQKQDNENVNSLARDFSPLSDPTAGTSRKPMVPFDRRSHLSRREALLCFPFCGGGVK
jgi:hypothetical protein